MGTTTTTQNQATKPIRFGPYEVTTQVFLTTPHSFALVNLKPLLPGHVLVCPHAPHKRLTDMSLLEITDLFDTVRKVQHMLARHYFGPAGSESRSSSSPDDGSFNIAIQDGADAGQTVPHLHVHVIPRIPGQTAKDGDTIGDAIYEDMAGEKGNVGGALWDRSHGLASGDGGGGGDEVGNRKGVNGDGNGRPVPGGSFDRIEDADRMARSMQEMEAEAAVFRQVLAQMERERDDAEER